MGLLKLSMRFGGIHHLLKPLVIVLAVSFLYITLRTPATSQLSEGIKNLKAEIDKFEKDPFIGRQGKLRKPIYNISQTKRGEDEMEQTLLTIYKRKLKEIKALHLHRSTATKSCEEEPSIDAACVDTKCSADFHPIPEENVRDILRRQYRIPDKYIQTIAKMVDRKSDTTRISFVTAASSNHFYECQVLMKNLIENVLPELTDFRFYVYDLGLKPDQVDTLKRHCPLCHVRKFPFGHLPPVFSNLKSYTWKPLLVHAHLAVSQYVFWMDSSVRFLTKNLTSVLETVQERGMQISQSHVSTPLHTNTRMYEYFGVKPCQMARFRELEGTFLIFHNDIFTQNAIILPWLSCAFAPNCMYPFDKIPADSSHYVCRTTKRKYSICHRFDQSALTTILSKIYTDDIGYILLKKNTINANRRGERIQYFPEKRKLL